MKRIFHYLKLLSLFPLIMLMPRDRKKILFGACEGSNFYDNPRHFMEKCLARGGFTCYWVGKEVLRARVEATGARFVRRGSLAMYWHLLTAKFYVCHVFARVDLWAFPTFGRVVVLNLWHGIPYKCIGQKQKNGDGVEVKDVVSARQSWIMSLLARFNEFAFQEKSWTSVSNDIMARHMPEAWPYVFHPSRIIRAGLPRNDYLIANARNTDLIMALKKRYAEILGLPIDKKWYLYLPTWRHDYGVTFSFATSDRYAEYAKELLRKDAIIIEKQHPAVVGKVVSAASQTDGPVFVLNREKSLQVDVQELLLVSDRLITDYSSCFFDYELMNRPVIHFAYDLNDYVNKDSGALYDLRKIAAGPIAETEDEMISALHMTDEECLAKRGVDRLEPIVYEKGQASSALMEVLA